jgi:murein DD-endopeptidase MepM/ murein hydrolase activator NlpD
VVRGAHHAPRHLPSSVSARPAWMAAAAIPAFLLACLVGVLLFLGSGSGAPASACSGAGIPAVAANPSALPRGAVAGYRGQQLVNAAAVMNAAEALHLTVQAQTLGVMVAMGESQLIVLDHGDAAGPDSRGLFQQRDNGAWGSYSDRMTPTISATNFFRALLAVTGWEDMPPTIAAHKVQGNSDPYYYVPYWDKAVLVVHALSGVTVLPVSVGAGDQPCADAAPAASGSNGWTKPAAGAITSPFSLARRNPVLGVVRPHTGTDIGAPCDAPIRAANVGVVVQAGPESGYGNLITIDHGRNTETRYAHMFNNGVLVRVGQHVTAGAQIARVGSAGVASGCHLHFEVRVGAHFVDPQPFMSSHGATLG